MRRIITAALIAVVLSTGLVAVPAPAPATAAFDNSIGIVIVPTQTWRARCRNYLVRWNFTPPSSSDGWTVIVRMRRASTGVSVRSEFWDSGSPNKRGQLNGRLWFPLCGATARPGRYKVEMQMIYSEGRDTFTKTRAPTYFRLVRR